VAITLGETRHGPLKADAADRAAVSVALWRKAARVRDLAAEDVTGAHRVPWPISFFCDEVSQDPSSQVALAASLGLSRVDVRSAWNMDVHKFDEAHINVLARLLNSAGIRTACLATKVGKRECLADAKTVERNLLHCFHLAEVLNVTSVRIFGFCRSPRSSVTPGVLNQAADTLGFLAALAQSRGITLMLEAERGLVVDGPAAALDVLRSVGLSSLRFIWDPGNMVDLGISCPTDKWFGHLGPFVGYVHLKDGTLGSRHTCLAGTGDGQVGQLLRCLFASGYAGTLSVEPNVKRLVGYGDDADQAVRTSVRMVLSVLAADVLSTKS
jgi:sugar phosphate isomerase/epimerase